MHRFAAQFDEHHLCTTVEFDGWPAAFMMHNFKVMPVESPANSSAECLADGFLAGKPDGNAGRRIIEGMAVFNLLAAHKFREKLVSPARVNLADAIHIDDVQTDSKNHGLTRW